MELITALQSQNYSSLQDYFKGRIKTLLNGKIETKKTEFLANLKNHNADLKNFVNSKKTDVSHVNTVDNLNPIAGNAETAK